MSRRDPVRRAADGATSYDLPGLTRQPPRSHMMSGSAARPPARQPACLVKVTGGTDSSPFRTTAARTSSRCRPLCAGTCRRTEVGTPARSWLCVPCSMLADCGSGFASRCLSTVDVERTSPLRALACTSSSMAASGTGVRRTSSSRKPARTSGWPRCGAIRARDAQSVAAWRNWAPSFSRFWEHEDLPTAADSVEGAYLRLRAGNQI